MVFRSYLILALLFCLALAFPPSGTAQESQKRPPPRSPRQMTPAAAELERLRADVIEKMKESRASAVKLLALHEEEKKKLSEEYERRKELYRQGLIGRAELNQTERALGEAMVRVDEDKRWLSESDVTTTEAVFRDAILKAKIQNKQESSAAKNRR